MKIYINSNHEIKAINLNTDETLTEIEVDRELAFGNKSDFMILNYCYKPSESGYSVYPAKDYTMLELVDTQANKISILSEKVDAQTVENTKVEESQNRQDREIIDSLLASTELFEMVMAMMPVTINTKENERVNGMVTVYVTLILKGVKTIEDVPVVIRPQVQEQLDLLLK